ncbi:MAG: SxtJ family membrane protein [Gemmataceae bacterium]
MLRQFAALCLLIFGALAGWQAWRGNTPLAVALLVLALGLGPTGLLWPSAVKPVFVGWMLLARPVGWLVSHLLLAILYHALFTPLGLFFRLIGRDRLQRQLRPELPSYWEPRPTMDDPRRYLRQY